ncbi:hypothetical protein [uncultured Paludibaculum sp.]|uniref:hypothetical protein n=1 Tax=uncultured Paludibaculum sp. TaxID=1765020 RepID=UPI002AABEF4F|nr:hypothetical protein [uncultured Paludibaculum sp.]
MPGHLEDELPVSALVKEAARGRSLQGKAAQDEGSGGESNILARTVPVDADQLNRLNLAELLLRDGDARQCLSEQWTNPLQILTYSTGRTVNAVADY